MKLIHIFKAGKHTDMSGQTKEYSQEDIEKIARQYNEQPEEARHYAPIVKLRKAGASNEWLLKHLGMDADELLRLKQLSGLASLFQEGDFSKAWEIEK